MSKRNSVSEWKHRRRGAWAGLVLVGMLAAIAGWQLGKSRATGEPQVTEGSPWSMLHLNGSLALSVEGEGCLVLDVGGYETYLPIKAGEAALADGFHHGERWSWVESLMAGPCWPMFRERMDAARGE